MKLVLFSDGTMYWVTHGNKTHREDGPAVILESGGQSWYFQDQLHRVGGPARIYKDGTKEWYQHGRLHREDGPAIMRSNGHTEWWIAGIRVKPRSPTKPKTPIPMEVKRKITGD